MPAHDGAGKAHFVSVEFAKVQADLVVGHFATSFHLNVVLPSLSGTHSA